MTAIEFVDELPEGGGGELLVYARVITSANGD